jgi:transcriptional regulator of NAD metabolism
MNKDSKSRRQAIADYLAQQRTPVNGTDLATIFQVSRQIIVQDIALLRAENRNILSTNKGYLLYRLTDRLDQHTTLITVQHTLDQTLEEMRTIVDYGGQMLDVSIDHELYGQIRIDLVINNLEDAEEFCQKLKKSTSKPLKELTDGVHFHTITAPSQKALKQITQELFEQGILLT